MLKEIAITVLASTTTLVAQELTVSGRVVDTTGAAISGASVAYGAETSQQKTETDSRGKFSLRITRLPLQISISAPGFETLRTTLITNQQYFSLHPAAAAEVVEVTSTRMKQERALHGADAVILERAQIEHSPSRMADDLLRNVPGFQLFRRTSSLAANPTSQGVSLRGLGASGASRALVIEDLVPLNDPFGGWVYWDRIPKLALDRIEVIRSGESDVYGRDALGGVVQLIQVPANENLVTIETSGGNRGAGDANGVWTRSWKDWGLAANGSILRWDGYIPVPSDQRGAADAQANVFERTGQMRITHRFADTDNIFLQGSWFGEERQNGTHLQNNRTEAQSVVAGSDFTAGGGLTSIRGFADWEHFHQSFSAIALDRNSESLTRLQFVPVQRFGIESQWARSFHRDDSLVIGASANQVDGVDDEVAYSVFIPQSRTVAGGIQNSIGVFGHLSIQPFKNLFLGLGGRLDRWENTAGFSRREVFAVTPPRTDFPDKNALEASPRVSIGWSVRPNLMLSAAAYKAFRPPTLNELYRGFRVGNVVTQANQGLSSERLNGFEAGLDLRFSRIHVAQTFFYNELQDAIANVTLSTTPALITRQRQNAGLIRSRGVDLVFDGRLAAIHWSAGYEFADSTITSFPAQPLLVGKLTAQSPRHSWSVASSYARSSWYLTLEVRGTGQQFDDDLNRFSLPAFAIVGLYGSKEVRRGVTLFAAAENLLNQRYAVGATPVATLGTPVSVRAGIRIQNPKHTY